MKRGLFIIAFFILTLAASVYAAPSSFDDKYAKANSLYEAGKYKQAQSILLPLANDKKISDEARFAAVILLSKSYRNDGKALEALSVLEKYDGTKRTETYWLQYGEICLELKRFSQTFDSSKNLYASSIDCIKAESAWLKARAEFGLENYLQTMEYCDLFVKLASEAKQNAELKGSSEVEAVKYLDDIAVEATKLKALARDTHETQLYGIDYVNYRKGRVFQAAGKWNEAVDSYGKIQLDGMLKEAATFYSIKCIEGEGDIKKAVKLYEAFISAKPLGLYREEAYLQLAELKYRHGSGDADTKEALKYTEKLLENAEAMRETDQAEALLASLKPTVVDEFVKKNPKAYLHQNDAGLLIRALHRPESIENRITAPWYTGEKKTRALLFKGFLLGELGLKPEAAVAYRTSEKSGARILAKDDAINTLLAGLCDSSYLLPKDISFAKIKKPQSRLIPLACFLHITERDKEAESLMKEIEIAAGKAPLTYEQATINLVKAQILHSSGKQKDAEKLLKGLYSDLRYKKLPHWPMASYLYANDLALSGKKKEACAVYMEVALDDKKSEYAPMALLALALSEANYGNKAQAEEACTLLIRKFSKTPYKDAADTLKRAVKHAEENELISIGVEKEDAKVILSSRTIVVPDSPKWQENLNGVSKADILLYNVKFIGRDNCSIIKKVGMKFPLDEPQIPSVDGNTLCFVRSPLLFVKSMRYDFDTAFEKK